MVSVRTKRIYEPADATDGQRVLVDRIWPRGISKETAALDSWLRDIAPSTILRKWFDHKPERWAEFLRRYNKELSDNPALPELKAMMKAGDLTLLYGAKESRYNNAIALQEYLLKHKR